MPVSKHKFELVSWGVRTWKIKLRSPNSRIRTQETFDDSKMWSDTPVILTVMYIYTIKKIRYHTPHCKCLIYFIHRYVFIFSVVRAVNITVFKQKAKQIFHGNCAMRMMQIQIIRLFT